MSLLCRGRRKDPWPGRAAPVPGLEHLGTAQGFKSGPEKVGVVGRAEWMWEGTLCRGNVGTAMVTAEHRGMGCEGRTGGEQGWTRLHKHSKCKNAALGRSAASSGGLGGAS